MSEQNNEQIVPIITTPHQQPKNTPVDDVVNAIRDFISKAPDTFNKAVERAVNVRDTTVLLRLPDSESDSLDTLVSAGIYKSRAEAANFLITEGIKAQSELFTKVNSKMEEIEKLRSELRQSVAP
jgi:Arc/MetJ-type ribon-helix-helix transcriptional regulator